MAGVTVAPADKEESRMLAGFKAFIMRGSVVDLAVGIVIGAAFSAVVTGLMDGLIYPLIAAVFGEPNISEVGTFQLNGADFSIGLFLQAVLDFLIVAAALYFFVVMPMNKFAERRRRVDEEVVEEPAADLALLTEIRDLLAAGSGGPAGTAGPDNAGPDNATGPIEPSPPRRH